ncbi:MAG: thioesterase family protein [Fibrobacterota bacterium]
MTDFVHQSRVRVRYAETDQMRYVYYANHLIYWEVARTECLAAWGFPYQQLEDAGYAVPVLQAHCDYVSPARYEDELVILARGSMPDKLRLRFDYETRRGDADGPLIATGWTLHVCMDQSGKPRRPPKELAERFATTP